MGVLHGFSNAAVRNCDVVVVGAGIAGLVAAVQAAELGATVIVLEVNNSVCRNTEGIFAVGSHFQREQGISITKRDIIAHEMKFFNYRVNALYWQDMIDNSGENIQWLEDNGVLFSGKVDHYYDYGVVPAFHWFKDGRGSNMTLPLESKAKELGVEFIFKTRGRELILEGSTVAGIIAETSAGECICIHSKAVILATGGFTNSAEIFQAIGIMIPPLKGSRNGDGIKMAITVGAQDRTKSACFISEPSFMNRGWLAPLPDWVNYRGNVLWVNENGERFASELCGSENSMCISNALRTQKKTFAIFGQSNLDAANEDVVEDTKKSLESEGKFFTKTGTISGLAEWTGADEDTLKKTIDHYNAMCDAGEDSEYDKSPSVMTRIEPPYYIGTIWGLYMQSVGGIAVNRKTEVLSTEGNTILGLFAAGTDACMLYGETYTISIPASCNGHNVHSGRTAAKNAIKLLRE